MSKQTKRPTLAEDNGIVLARPETDSILSNETEFEPIKSRVLAIRALGINESDLDQSAFEETISSLRKMSTDDLRLTARFLEAVKSNTVREFARQILDDPSSGLESDDNGNRSPKPKWASRTTGREITPVDWIKSNYGKWVDGKWDADGLTRADISHIDRSLYDAYVARIRRLPDEDLGLATKAHEKITDPKRALENKRKTDRAGWHRRHGR